MTLAVPIQMLLQGPLDAKTQVHMPCSPQAYHNKRKDFSYGPLSKEKGLKHPWAE